MISTYRGRLNIAESVAMAASATGRASSQAIEQRADAYAALVEDCERVVDEVGGAEHTPGDSQLR
jgi:hypothetical protein